MNAITAVTTALLLAFAPAIHAANAYTALTDTIELSRAVQRAVELTDPEETLIIVTADHSHVFTIAGYPTRGNPILGKVISNADDGSPEDSYAVDSLDLPYTTLGYSNGPGYTGPSSEQSEGTRAFPHYGSGYKGIRRGRPDLTGVDTSDPAYLQAATVPLYSETHAGEDVAIYAAGPAAHLFHGVQEQSYVYYVMAESFGLSAYD